MTERGAVVQLVPAPAKPRADCATVALAVLVVLVGGGVRIARIAAYTVVLLLAALGVVSLLGRPF